MVCDFDGRYNGRRCEFHGLPCVIPAFFVWTNKETVLFEYYLAGYGRGVSAARSGGFLLFHLSCSTSREDLERTDGCEGDSHPTRHLIP